MAQEPELKPGKSPVTGTSEESVAALARMGADDSLCEQTVNPLDAKEPEQPDEQE